jgi:hypothetical protein
MRKVFYSIKDVYHAMLVFHYIEKFNRYTSENKKDEALKNREKAVCHLKAHKKICDYFGAKDDTEDIIEILYNKKIV